MERRSIDISRLADTVRVVADTELMPRFRRVSATRKADGSLLAQSRAWLVQAS